MLNSRNSFLREVIIDRCLRSKVPMSRKEIENELSKFLEAHDESKGDSKEGACSCRTSSGDEEESENHV